MLNIPNNPVKEFSVVSECYELLGATDGETNTENYFKNEWLLKRASSNAPLREARIRSFKPLTRLTPYHVIPTATGGPRTAAPQQSQSALMSSTMTLTIAFPQMKFQMIISFIMRSYLVKISEIWK